MSYRQDYLMNTKEMRRYISKARGGEGLFVNSVLYSLRSEGRVPVKGNVLGSEAGGNIRKIG